MHNEHPLADYNQLLHAVYTGPRQNPPWAEFLTTIKRQTEADVAVIAFGSRAQVTRINYVNGTDRRDYRMPFLELSPFTEVPVGEVTTLEDFCGTQQLLQSDFYRICLEPINVRHMIGLNFFDQNDQFAYLRLGRTSARKNFGKTDRKLFHLLFPHFHSSSEMITELHSLHFQRDLLHELMGRIGLGIVTTDSQLKVKSFNEAAAQILQKSHSMRLAGSRLQIRDGALRQAVKQLLASDDAEQRRQFHLTSGGDDIRLAIRPQHPQGQGWETHDICFCLSDGQSRIHLSEHTLSEIYGLTQREARIASLLVQGLAVDDIVAQEGISRNTAYTHIKAIFLKLDVSRQSSLVSRVLTSPVTLN